MRKEKEVHIIKISINERLIEKREESGNEIRRSIIVTLQT